MTDVLLLSVIGVLGGLSYGVIRLCDCLWGDMR